MVAFVPSVPEPAGAGLRIVTYNIRGGLGIDNVRSIRRIVDVLAEIDADVICLQEVHRRLPWSGFEDQPAKLAKRLGLVSRIQANLRVGFGGFGNLILSRWPISSYLEHAIPNERERTSILRRPERRGFHEATIAVPSGPITVLNTHWSLNAEDRLEAAGIVAGRVRQIETPVILVGDFNAPASEQAILRLASESGLLDSGAAESRTTFTSDKPTERIDYVWVSSHIMVSRLFTVDSQASDHLPVVAEMEIK